MKPIRALSAVCAAIAVLLLAAAPSGAHGGEGEAEITAVTREGDDVTVTARLVFVDDGHGVPDATVTVVVDDGTPVPMEPGAEEGDYEATVAAPEGAAIRVTSVEPATTAEAVAPPTEPAGTETTTAETTTTEAGTTTTVLDGDDDAAAPITAPEDIDGDSDDSSGSLIVIAVIAVVVVAALVAAVVLRRRPADGSGADGDGA